MGNLGPDFPSSAFEVINLVVRIKGPIHLQLANLSVRKFTGISGFAVLQNA